MNENEENEIETEETNKSYRQVFNQIGMQISDSLSYNDWIEVYKRLVYWELELAEIDGEMSQMLKMQKQEANNTFAKFIRNVGQGNIE